MEEKSSKKAPSFGLSLGALGIIVVCLFLSIMVFKISIHAGLLMGMVGITFLSRRLGYRFEDLLKFATKSLGDVRTVQVHIHNIRKKIEKDPANPIYLTNEWGRGYFFCPELHWIGK